MSGRLLAIARREKSRGAMEVLDQARVTMSEGVTGDLRGRPGGRQVTVLARESWEKACAIVGSELPWTTRRANLLVEGVVLEATTGRQLHIADVVLEVTGETGPCARMDEQQPGLRAALEPAWGGGITCRVVSGGTLRTGDTVSWEPAE